MTLKTLNDKYKYKSDQKWFDTWTGLEIVGDKYLGDCEDYCITLKNKVPHNL